MCSHNKNTCRESCSSQTRKPLEGQPLQPSDLPQIKETMKITKGTIIADVYEQCSPEMKKWFDEAGPEEHVMLLEGLVEYDIVPREMFELMKEVILEHDGQMTPEHYTEFLAMWYDPSSNIGKRKLH